LRAPIAAVISMRCRQFPVGIEQAIDRTKTANLIRLNNEFPESEQGNRELGS